MENYLATAIILCFYLRTVLTEADLLQQNAAQDQLNPLNDFENADTSIKEQDKRTIFNSANYGWAKHVGIKHSGHKYVIGYSPVDLKYAPVIRPLTVRHPGYVYGKPKVHFHRPVVQLRPAKPVVWKPSVAVKPVVAVHVPPPAPSHHHHLISKPVGVAHLDHVHIKPVPHVDHIPHVDHVHQVQVPHTDIIHQIQVPHAGHVHNVPVHVDHVHPAPVHPVPVGHVQQVPVHPVAVAHPVSAPLPQHLVPVVPGPQFIPSPLFEVTKPNLGVLPLGVPFPSPIFKSIPHIHAVPFPVRPALLPHPIAPAPVPLPHAVPVPRPALIPQPQPLIPQPTLQQPLIPQPALPQPAYPPGTVVEYHGATNFVNQIPLPPIPAHPGSPHLHFQFSQIPQQHIHPQPAPVIPHEQHDVQTPVIPPNHPHFFQQPIDLPQFQQQLPLEAPSHFQPSDQANNNVFQQQLPVNTQQTQFQTDQDQQFIQQAQDSATRYQPADQVSTQQFFQGSVGQQEGHFEQLDQQEGGYVYQRPDVPFGQQSIQPGDTDLQLPVHLPQHPGFVQNARQFQQSNPEESARFHGVFKPSIQLEPPYKK